MTCQRCGGQLYADRAAMADLAHSGYIGGRIYCLMGCTDQWLKERAAGVPDFTAVDESKIKIIRCLDCGIGVRTRNAGTKRCDPCRKAKALKQGRLSWQRFAERQRTVA